jgi:hypothetical protein
MPKLLTKNEAINLGEKFYFTGLVCKNGHISLRRVSGYRCVECEVSCRPKERENELAKIRYALNKEIVCQRKKEWRIKNYDKALEINKQSKARRKNKIAQYYLDNKEKFLLQSRERYARDANKINQRHRARYQQNKAPHFAKAAKRRASKLQATPTWSEADKIIALYTGAEYLSRLTGVQWDVDHEVPLKHKLVSGLHVYSNLQLLPHVDNLKKSNNFSVVEVV